MILPTRPDTASIGKRRLKMILVILLGTVIVLYGFFELRNFIRGPKLTIFSPKNYSDQTEPFIVVSGRADRVDSLTMSGRRIYTDQNGLFLEPLLLSWGYNIISLEGSDRLGRSVSQKLEIVFNP